MGFRRNPPGRVLPTIAIGFLLLDAALLTLAGATTHRFGLVVWGALCAAGAGAVVLLWRSYLRRLAELDRARESLRDEIKRIGQALDEARN